MANGATLQRVKMGLAWRARRVQSLVVGKRIPLHVMRRGVNLGFCPICELRTLFYSEGAWKRDQYKCIRCHSIPRWRALVHVLETHFPSWRDMRLHESSPGGPASSKLAHECKAYLATHYYPGTPSGQARNGFRCEDLEAQTFADESFDLVVTQDVFEHLFDAASAFREIARTLAPGGAHVFTVPWYYWKSTLVRSIRENGTVRHLEEPDYHCNPVDSDGSLVVREWGWDLIDFIYRHSGLTTTAIRLFDRRRGLEAQFLEVFVSQKPPAAELAAPC